MSSHHHAGRSVTKRAEIRGQGQEFLVFYEFGSDFVDSCRAGGFEVSVLQDRSNPALVSFIAEKPG